MPLRKSAATLVLCIVLVTAAAFTGRASASNTPAASVTQTVLTDQGAFVFNRGTKLGSNCEVLYGTWSGTGSITHLVQTPSDLFNFGCEGWGPPITDPITIGSGSNKLQIEANGHWTLSFNGV